jgi:hypothetical protein
VETPVLVNLQEEYGDQRFQVIGIAVRDDLEAVRAAIDEYGINYPVLFDDGSLSEAFGRALPAGMIEGYPTNLYAGPGGEIRAVSTGAPSNPAFVERVFRVQVEYQLERVWERLEKR